MNKLEGAKVLITGGAGFIGSNLAAECLRRGCVVRVVDNLSTGNLDNLAQIKEKIDFLEGDLSDINKARKAASGMDYIFHLAAIPSVPRSIKDPLSSHNSNLNATLNILLAAKENSVKKLVYSSSSSAYGDSPTLPKKESHNINPISFYALQKYGGERYCQLFSALYGLPTVSLRYFNVFGPHQDFNSEYGAVIPKFVKSIYSDERPVIFGDGETTRDFTYIDNVVSANILAAECEASGEVINIACGERISLNRLAGWINKILDKSIEPIYQPEREGDIKHSLADISKAKEILGYAPKIDMEGGLKNFINWYKTKV